MTDSLLDIQYDWEESNKDIFDLEKYRKTGSVDYVMHCSTPLEAACFTSYLCQHYRSWASGDSYAADNKFKYYESRTCYAFNRGQYSPIEYYQNKNQPPYGDYCTYIILEFSDFDWEGSVENGWIV